MYFRRKEKTLDLSLGEAVHIAHARYGGRAEDGKEARACLFPTLSEASLSTGAPQVPNGAVLFSREIPFGDFSLRLFGCAAPTYDENGALTSLSLRAEISENPENIDASTLKHIRAHLFLLAALAGIRGEISLRAYIYSRLFDKTVTHEEKPALSAVSRFFEKTLAAIKEDAHLEVDRVTRRLPSFLSVPFPYGEAREGQKSMMSAVFSVAKHGETLFAIAPTGTGKTMAVLFPALRALGAREVEKVFYLTPKYTSALAALDAIELLSSHGAAVRALHLGAKERLCAHRKESGSCRGCLISTSEKKQYEACLSLLSEEKAAVKEEDILRASRAHGVCPHQLSLSYSAYADVVVCDYNYLFDPHVSLSRYFERGGKYLFLIDEAHNLPDRARETYSAELSDTLFDTLSGLFEDSLRLKEVTARLKDVFLKTADALLAGELRTDEKGEAAGFAHSPSLPTALLSAVRKCTDIYLKEIRKKRGKESQEDKLLRECVYALRDFVDKADCFDEHFVTYALREGERRTIRLFCTDPSVLIGERLDKGKAAVFFSATLSPLDYYRSVLCGRRAASKMEVPSPFDNGALCVGVIDSVSVRASAREDTLDEIARLIISAMRARRGNYMVFCPSFAYLERVAEAFHRLTPKTPIAVQKRNMTREERETFLNNFSEQRKGYFVGFCVTGGIYAEGVDLAGERLIGAIIVGMGLPQVSAEREMIAAYYEDVTEEGRSYAYFYPALNRIMQAAGRVIRSESDHGVVVLIDDRLRDPLCKKMFPSSWRHLKYLPDRNALGEYIARFWQSVDEEGRNL